MTQLYNSQKYNIWQYLLFRKLGHKHLQSCMEYKNWPMLAASWTCSFSGSYECCFLSWRNPVAEYIFWYHGEVGSRSWLLLWEHFLCCLSGYHYMWYMSMAIIVLCDLVYPGFLKNFIFTFILQTNFWMVQASPPF